MDTKILEDLGFTNAEIKIYLALLELGSTTAGPIIQKTKLQNSVVHMTLHKLVEKGFAAFIVKGKTRHYHATDPRNIGKYIDEKKSQFEQLLPQLLVKQQKQEPQAAEIYEGFKGFKNMLREFIKDAKKGEEFLFFAFYTKNPEDYRYVYNYYRKYEVDRLEKGIVVKGIAPKSLKGIIKQRKTKILYVDFPIPENISVFQDKVFFTPWEDKQISYLIHSAQLAESFRRYFHSIWDRYETE